MDDDRNLFVFSSALYKSALWGKWQYGECQLSFPWQQGLMSHRSSSLWSMRSHYSVISDFWFPVAVSQININHTFIHRSSSVRRHYPHLCRACLSSALQLYSVFHCTASDQYSIHNVFVCVSAVPTHLRFQTTSARASLSWWSPPCEWQAPFPWRQRWSEAPQTWLVRRRVTGVRSIRCRASPWMRVKGCLGL